MAESERGDQRTVSLAEARQRFLREEDVGANSVRDTILASWWRSHTWNVAAEHVELPYIKDPDLDTPLTQSAGRVLRRLQDQLGDSTISAILTDERGVVLDRRTEGRDLERYLDGVLLAPGFSYSEQFVGTNGIGTALEGLQPISVFGHEHYAEDLDTLACAGVPIRHPVSGQTVGLFDLTCWRKDANALLMTLARSTAKDIQHELATQVGLRELSLFTEYMRACRRGQGIVFAVNNDIVMTNEYARQSLEPQDQAALLAEAAEVLTHRKHTTLTVPLPSGAQAWMSCSPVNSDAGPAGGIVRARLLQESVTSGMLLAESEPRLPGVVGASMLWTRACQQVAHHHELGEWLTVTGETGSGKTAIIRGVHAKNSPTAHLTVLDLADEHDRDEHIPRLREALTHDEGTIVLRHLDRLPQDQAHELASTLAEVSQDDELKPWVVATTQENGGRHVAGAIVRHFPSSVAVPPLRYHLDDIRDLVPHLLRRLTQGGGLTCSAEALRTLLRSAWPGNIAQLRDVLGKVVAHRRAGTIQPQDLPPECSTVSGRVLSPLESMERDEIVRCLHKTEGNKTRTAHELGLSRATIYRKIRDYGIDVLT